MNQLFFDFSYKQNKEGIYEQTPSQLSDKAGRKYIECKTLIRGRIFCIIFPPVCATERTALIVRNRSVHIVQKKATKLHASHVCNTFYFSF